MTDHRMITIGFWPNLLAARGTDSVEELFHVLDRNTTVVPDAGQSLVMAWSLIPV